MRAASHEPQRLHRFLSMRGGGTLFLACAILCAVVAGGSALAQAPAQRQKKAISGKEPKMDTQLLEQLQGRNYEALDTTRRLGEKALDTLVATMDHQDGEVRELAVMCLNEIPGAAPGPALVQALGDTYVAVPTRAATYLLNHHSPDMLPQLFAALNRNRSPVVRARLALVIGAVGNPGAVPELIRLAGQPNPPELARSLRLAAARLSAEPMLSEFLAELSSESPKVRFQALRDFEYLRRPDLLRHVAPLLDDKTPISPIDSPPARDVLRICDFAVLVIAKVTRPALSFNAVNERIFSDREIAEMKASIRL